MNYKKKLQWFVESNGFQNAVVWAIIGCSILLGVETYYPPETRIFIVFDVFFSSFFLLEILVRILASGNLFTFFRLFKRKKNKYGIYHLTVDERGFWNWFDFLIVLFTSISLFKHFVEHPEFLVVSRLFRVLRILRLLEVSEELKMVERKIISIIPTVFSFVLLLGILIYIYSIIGIYLFEHKDFGMADFSDIPGAFMTLFQLMTLDGWTEVMHSAESSTYNTVLIKGFFISFVIFTAIISFNVFVAVLTTHVHEKMIEETAQRTRDSLEESSQTKFSQGEIQEVLRELQALRTEVRNLQNQK